MKRLLLALALLGCTDPLGPGDPGFDDECVVYIADGEPIEIPEEMVERCESIEVYIVRVG